MRALLIPILLSALFLNTAVAQSQIPSGTIIPVRLGTRVDAGHSQPGQILKAQVAQDVPLYNGREIKARTWVFGEVVSATPATNSQPATVTLRFDRIVSRGESIPVSMHLRALASPDEVRQAEYPTNPIEIEKLHFSMTTVQIGGNDVVYRGGGPVSDGQEIVGKPIEGSSPDLGVLSYPAAYPGKPCQGPVAGNDKPQALWLFSHDACGAYGYDVRIVRTARQDAEGLIVLESAHGNLELPKGTALLLRVNANTTADNLPKQ